MTNKLVSISLGLMMTWAVGCGGNVNGSGGGGAGGGTTTTTPTKKDPKTICGDFCSAFDAAGCLAPTTVADCTSQCTGDFADYPECSAQFTALAQCGQGITAANCDVEMVCADQLSAADMCRGNGCDNGTCAASDTTCSCNTTCNGVGHQMDCDSSSGTTKCTCTEDSAIVGMCDATDLSCDVETGCCAAFWSK
ncbi:MAG: hypothetical protein U0441_00845 [Polyangiaceae bacterium]